MMFESAYLIQNKKINYCLKVIFLFIFIPFLLIYFYKYPKTIYYEGLVIERNGDNYLRILSKDTKEFTNDYMKLIIDDKYYKYEVNNIEQININNAIYYYVDLSISKKLILNSNVKLNIYLGKTTLFKEITKNLKKGIAYGQT